MIKVELTPKGLHVVVETVFSDPRKLQELISKLAEAKEQLVESIGRKSEEGHHELWESS